MQRWHAEEALMRRRQKVEILKHRNRITGELDQCHCLAGIGTMRKHRPNESCGDHCGLCDLHRDAKRRARRRQRRLLKKVNDSAELRKVAQDA